MTIHLLIVEDNASDVALLRELLTETKEPPELHWVTNGAEALSYLHARAPYQDAPRPDLILLDLGLPRIGGYEVLKELKTEEKFSAIPVIVLSTSRNPLDREESAASGAHLYISKPQNLQGYEDLVDQLLTREIPRLVANG